MRGGMAMSQQAVKSAKQNITRECHFLPVCYQQGFTNPNGEWFIQFLNHDKPKSLAPVAVGKINDFYTRTVDGVDDDGIEDFFCQFVEGDYARVAKRIKEEKNEFMPQKEDINVFLKFVATQIVRTLAHRHCIDQQAGAKVPPFVFHHNMHRKMRFIIDRWQRQLPDVILETPLPIIGSQFITGDNPIICYTIDENAPAVFPPVPKILDLKQTLESAQNGFLVALSPYIRLAVVNSSVRKEITLQPPRCIETHQVRAFNKLIYDQCMQFVGAQDAEHLNFHVKKIV
jgi:hypothetical protein